MRLCANTVGEDIILPSHKWRIGLRDMYAIYGPSGRPVPTETETFFCNPVGRFLNRPYKNDRRNWRAAHNIEACMRLCANIVGEDIILPSNEWRIGHRGMYAIDGPSGRPVPTETETFFAIPSGDS